MHAETPKQTTAHSSAGEDISLGCILGDVEDDNAMHSSGGSTKAADTSAAKKLERC